MICIACYWVIPISPFKSFALLGIDFCYTWDIVSEEISSNISSRNSQIPHSYSYREDILTCMAASKEKPKKIALSKWRTDLLHIFKLMFLKPCLFWDFFCVLYVPYMVFYEAVCKILAWRVLETRSDEKSTGSWPKPAEMKNTAQRDVSMSRIP